jgi:predicted dehydrogenase
LEIAFTEGYLELQGILSGSKSYGEERLVKGRRDESDTGTAKEEVITYLEDNSWRDEINEFADAISSGRSVNFGSSADALATMKLVYKIYWSDSEWRDRFNIALPDSGIKQIGGKDGKKKVVSK